MARVATWRPMLRTVNIDSPRAFLACPEFIMSRFEPATGFVWQSTPLAAMMENAAEAVRARGALVGP